MCQLKCINILIVLVHFLSRELLKVCPFCLEILDIYSALGVLGARVYPFGPISLWCDFVFINYCFSPL